MLSAGRAYTLAFGIKRRGRLARKLAKLLRKPIDVEREPVELDILEIMYNEEGEFSSEAAGLLLPYLRAHQLSLLQSYSVENNPDAIRNIMAGSTAAKYGKRFDAGWHLYCLHDLVIACEECRVRPTGPDYLVVLVNAIDSRVCIAYHFPTPHIQSQQLRYALRSLQGLAKTLYLVLPRFLRLEFIRLRKSNELSQPPLIHRAT